MFQVRLILDVCVAPWHQPIDHPIRTSLGAACLSDCSRVADNATVLVGGSSLSQRQQPHTKSPATLPCLPATVGGSERIILLAYDTMAAVDWRALIVVANCGQ